MADTNLKAVISLEDQMSSVLKGIERNVGNFNKNVGSKLADVGKTIAVAGTAITAGAGVVGGALLKSASDVQNMQVALKTAFQGSKTEADNAYKVISEFAKKTPYQMGEVMTAFIKLKNMGLDPSNRALEAYGNTASSMGKSLNQMIEAVADAATGEFERLKEFGIRAKKDGDNVQFTFQGVTTTVKNNAKDIEGYLIKLGETKFAGGMEAQSQTLSGKLSTLKDEIGMMFNEIAVKSGLLDFATEAVGRFSDWISKVDIAHKIELIKASWDYLFNGDSYDRLVELTGMPEDEGLVKFLTNVQEEGKKLLTLWEEHKKTIETVAIILGAYAIAYTTVTGAVKAYNAVIAIAGTVTKTFGVAMAFLTSPIGLVVLAIGAVIAIGVLLWRNWDWVSAKASEIGASIARVWNGIVTSIGNAINSIVWAIQNWQFVLGAIIGYIAGTWVNSVTSSFNMIKNGILGFINWVNWAIPAMVDGVASFFRSIPGKVGNFWQFLQDGIPSAHNAIRNAINWIGDRFKELPGTIANALGGMWNIGRDALGRFWSGLLSNMGKFGDGIKAGLRAAGFTGLASGTSYAQAGMYKMNETGQEAVYLPQGARVVRSSDTRDMMKASGETTININNPVVRNDSDIDRLVQAVTQALDNNQRLKRLGV